MNFKMDLQQIIKKLKYICSQEGLTISPDVLLEQSVDIFISEKINESRQLTQSRSNVNKEINPYKDDKPTDKQVWALKKLGKYDAKMNKQEATQIIKESKSY